MNPDRPRRSDSVSSLPREQTSRVLRILENYLSDLEQGRQPDRDTLLAQHPELAEKLGVYLDKLEVLHQAAAGLRPHAAPTEALATSLIAGRGQLGDYRILREVGRGGMGVVYEAEQISLCRRVALKILPFAAALDSKQLQRFRNEAQAAAHLHHTHIVPVYAVGTERGVHYYAMQFIEGQTLAAMIAELRRQAPQPPSRGTLEPATESFAQVPPSDRQSTCAVAAETTTLDHRGPVAKRSTKNPAFFRTVAELGVQAALALEHAHQMGIIHRDIKPANLLLDARVHLWITDFGLARGRGEDGLTLTGDLVGTLRYMSPEQALGKRLPVDHRTDIYSLGVTLYEFLTLRPAYDGRDRQELLHQLTFEEPLPLRRLKAAVPRELETIVQKAMAKEPDDRYATAQELADDLQRFLDHKPILAKKPTLRERLHKWEERHKGVVCAAAGLLLLAVVALGAHSVLIAREKDQTQLYLKEAELQRKEAGWRLKDALRERARADANFRMLRAAATQILHKLRDNRLANVREIDTVRQVLAEELLRFFQGLVHEDSPDAATRLETGLALMLMGNVYRVQGECLQCQEHYEKAIGFFESLVNEFPQDAAYRGELAIGYDMLGRLLADRGMTPGAGAALKQAAIQYRASLERAPTLCILNNFAWFLATCPEKSLRDRAEALEVAKRAISVGTEWGESWNTLGVAFYRNGQYDKAIETLRKSMELRAGGDAFDWFFLAMAYHQKGDKDEAEHWYGRAVRELGQVDAYIYEPIYQYHAEAAALLGKKLPKPKEKWCRFE
jgi:serine/threonine protein kinase/tetratricopeptide (TPR) repeat protein